MMRNFSLAVALAALLGSATVVRAAVTVSGFSDDFSTSQTASTNNASSGFDTGNTLITASGSRALFTNIVSNAAPGDARARTAISGGVFTFSSDAEVTGMGYDVNNFTSPISLTLTPLVQVVLLSNDMAGVFTVQITDSNSVVTNASYTLPAVTGGLPVNLYFPLNLAGINSGSITKLTFGFGGTKGEDLSVDAIRTQAVPEPGTAGIVLLVGSVLGLSLLARRRLA